jgi:teichuronic acid biosynthesis glycosyltransferase TuaC
MRVLFVTNMWPDAERPWYGAYVQRQAESLGDLGLEVDVIAIRGYAGRAAYLSRALDVMRIRPGRYRIVHGHYGHAGVVARLQVGAPLVVTYCGDDLLGTADFDGSLTRRSTVEAAVFRQLARVCARTITQSEQMAGRLPAACRERNAVIPNGVDLDRFRPGDRAESRRTLGWAPSEAVVLFVGDPRLAVKNFALARETVARAAAAAAARAGAGAPVRLQVVSGRRPDEVPLLMAAADALLVTSRSEGSPNVVKEAMASELPVVATPVGDVRELLEGVPGCHVRAAEPGPLAEALGRALRHGRTPAARRAVARLAAPAVARRILGVYEEALAGRGSARQWWR